MIKPANKTKSEKQRLFVTVGTSIFSNMVNWANKNNHPHLSLIETIWKELILHKASASHIDVLKQIIAEEFLIQNYQGQNKFNTQASAEIQSIQSIQNNSKWKHIVFDLHLITTDTLLSNLSAEMIQYYFQNNKYHIDNIFIQKIEGLQVHHQIRFQTLGFQHLVNYLLEKHQEDGVKALINVTGGYKAIIPVLSIVGQLLGIPLVYNYETTDELLVIQPMPLGFDWTYMELYRYFLSDLESKIIVRKDGSQTKERVFDLNKLADTKLKNFFLKEMYSIGFMEHFENTSYYKSSFLGNLLNRHIEKSYPIAAQNFGLPLEFLFYEHFLKEAFQWNGFTFSEVKHREKFSINHSHCEIDFMLSTKEKPRKQIVCELTSFGQLFVTNHYQYEFKKQLKLQVELFKTKQLQVDLYLLLLYGFKMSNDWNIIEQGMQKVWKELKKAGIQTLKIMTTDLPISQVAQSNNTNVYSAIYQKKVTQNKDLWTNHQQDTYGNPFLLLKDYKTFSIKETINV
ncbi:MAG TPA: hypothetical protein ENK52_04710 [Saprospiraceae bacterium]|nr:hypothetical protein [Saprospiraceae bacterium]